jgi:mannosyltransferase
MSKRNIQAWLLLLAVLVALSLRVGTLGRRSLWGDEVATLRISALEMNDIITIQWDQHPPLYYLLMHHWIPLVQGEFLLRLPSALAGAAAVPLLYWLTREWSGQWSAMASAWFLAIMPLHIWYSQEARMYALVCTLGLASTLFYTLAIRRKKPLIWSAWIVMTVAGLYTHYSMLLLAFTQIGLLGPLWKASNSNRTALWIALLALLLVSLLFVPQARTFVRQLVLSGWQGGYYYMAVQSMLSKWGILISPSQLYTAIGVTAALVLGIGVFSTNVLLSRLKQTQVGTRLILAALAVYVLILIATAIPRGLGIKRQLLILLPYALGGIAALISPSPYRTRLLAVLILVTLPVTGHIVAVREQEAWRDVAQLVENSEEPQDIILFDPSWRQHDFDYYYRGDVPRQRIGEKDVPETLINIIASHQRVWLVQYIDPPGKVQRWLDENCTLLDEHIFPGVRMRLYDTGPPD